MAETIPEFRLPTDTPNELPVLALIRGELLPGAIQAYTVGRDVSLSAIDAAVGGMILVAAQREPVRDAGPSDLITTATVARILEQHVRNGARQLVVQGLGRATLTGFVGVRPHFTARWARADQPWPSGSRAEAMAAELDLAATTLAERLGRAEQAEHLAHRLPDPGLRADALAALVDAPAAWRRDILVTLDPLARAEKVLIQLAHTREVLEARKSINDRVQEETRDKQKEFVLRQQLEAIRKELGEGDEDHVAELRAKLAAAEVPGEVQAVVDRELSRLDRMGNASAERNVSVDWLTWIADIPWSKTSSVDLDLDALEAALDASHAGLSDVKRQVVEHLSVRRLAGSGRADVLLLVGPPGVGKTSIAQAIADATGRKLVRVALGGVRDEAELRGHRRTYIGARPGRLVEGIRRAGAIDPVILLDEVDKLSNSFLGNPAAALLEILDPEQNQHFVDHYLEVPLDLSRALFIATANDLSSVPAPLLDRMERLEITGYAPEEKLAIAQRHLLGTLARQTGLRPDDVQFTDDALRAIIDGWTREAGVRELQRVLGRVWRAAAVLTARGQLSEPLKVDVADLEKYLDRPRFRKEEHETPGRPGVALGLAWTPVGGDVLYVEASTLPGSGKLVLTGQLGDVMKESARAALTFVLDQGERLGIPAIGDRDVHIHVPAGATPKDGPSAGVTMFTALASLLWDRRIRPDTAMTGEATLRGRVLPVGGIRAKVLAAHQRGLRRVILPKRNRFDLQDVPEHVRAEMEFILVDQMSEVLDAALEPLQIAERPAA